MAEVVSHAHPIARKPHRCDHCRREIPAGTRYAKFFIVDGGEAWSWVAHEDCDTLAYEIWLAGDYCEDEGVTLHEEWASYPSETAEWRGKYPHVICRLELNAQLSEARNG